MTNDRHFTPLNELISLSGKKALVTGGAMGIGFAIASRLAEAGAVVAILDTNREKGLEAVQDIINHGYKAFFVACDVSHEEQVKVAFEDASTRMDGLDIVVNNAGIFPLLPVMQMTAESMEKVLSVNVKGLLYLLPGSSPIHDRAKEKWKHYQYSFNRCDSSCP